MRKKSKVINQRTIQLKKDLESLKKIFAKGSYTEQKQKVLTYYFRFHSHWMHLGNGFFDKRTKQQRVRYKTVLLMRLRGHSWRDCAKALGVNTSSQARLYYDRAIKLFHGRDHGWFPIAPGYERNFFKMWADLCLAEGFKEPVNPMHWRHVSNFKRFANSEGY